jgi:predicted Co/Zn/Cd cation transporter (cation efflux family)
MGEMESLVKSTKRKRRRRRKRDAARRLKQRVQRQFPNKKVQVVEAHDGVKMSEVLKAFVAPFRHLAETEEEFLKLVAIAVAAWNISLLPAKEREASIQELLEALPQDAREDAEAIIGELVEWKEEYFAQHKRIIIDYEVTDMGQDYQLTVISIVDESQEP